MSYVSHAPDAALSSRAGETSEGCRLPFLPRPAYGPVLQDIERTVRERVPFRPWRARDYIIDWSLFQHGLMAGLHAASLFDHSTLYDCWADFLGF